MLLQLNWKAKAKGIDLTFCNFTITSTVKKFNKVPAIKTRKPYRVWAILTAVASCPGKTEEILDSAIASAAQDNVRLLSIPDPEEISIDISIGIMFIYKVLCQANYNFEFNSLMM